MNAPRWLPLTLVLSSCSHRWVAPHPELASAPVLAVTQGAAERARSEATGHRYVVSTQGVAASEAAREMFKRGGNAIDAALAASFVISVERPQSTGLGGGGFWLFRQADSQKIMALDFREQAPRRATPDMYLDAKGQVIPNQSIDGVRAVAVPGLVAGLLEMHGKFASLPLRRILAPAIRLAESGFPVYPDLRYAMERRQQVLARDPAARKIFLKADGSLYQVGERLVQKDLARALRMIARDGKAGFYRGPIAQAITDLPGGLITQADLDAYRPVWRDPAHGTFHGFDIYSMPPPSSGGAHVIEILNLLERVPLSTLGFQSAQALHFEAAAMQQVFADRAKYLGDSDFVKVPLRGLTDKDYADTLWQRISPDKARSARAVKAGNPWPFNSDDPSAKPGRDGPGAKGESLDAFGDNPSRSPSPRAQPAAPKEESLETTHLSIMDADGNMVSSTQTINGYFGSGIVAPGTGIVLNNEMDDFSAKPGARNLFGAVGGLPNAIAPGKRPLSSMSPTIVMREDVPVMALGAPGGTRILTCVAQALVNYLEFEQPLYESIASVRVHHQWQPDELQVEEPGLRPEATHRLEALGYTVKTVRPPCRVNAVAREAGGLLRGVADPRDIGASLAE